MNSKIIAGLAIAAALVLGIIIFTSLSSEENNETMQNTSVESSVSESYTKAEVAMHAEESDCWTYINDNVYDLTSYIPRHVGGDEILRACGQDGTSLFERRTTSDGEKVGSGTPHSDRAESFLEDLKIGILES